MVISLYAMLLFLVSYTLYTNSMSNTQTWCPERAGVKEVVTPYKRGASKHSKTRQ